MHNETHNFAAHHYAASLHAAGLTAAQINQGFQDLGIILRAQEKQPQAAFALTALADKVFHVYLGTPEMDAYVADAHGPGARHHHDPDAWGTEAYGVAWAHTREAFAAAGILLDADPAAARDDGRQGEVCIRTVQVAMH